MMKRNSARAAAEDAGQTVSDAVSALDDIAPDLADIADAAVDTVAATARLSVRLATGTLRFVGRHPRQVLTGIALVAVVVGVMSYLRSQSTTDSSPAS